MAENADLGDKTLENSTNHESEKHLSKNSCFGSDNIIKKQKTKNMGILTLIICIVRPGKKSGIIFLNS